MPSKTIEDALSESPADEQVTPEKITPYDVNAVYQDLYELTDNEDGEDNQIAATRQGFVDELRKVYGTPDVISSVPSEQIIGKVLRASSKLGVTDDIAAKFARNVRRLKGERIKEGDVSEIFSQYGIQLPPLSEIDFTGDSGNEGEKIDGWAQKAKSLYNLRTKTKSPELLAYRDEVFQRIDDSAKYLKRKVGATDSSFVDFAGRLAEGGATFLDTLGLEGVGNFVRSFSASNPDWDGAVSTVVGQGIGQAAAMFGAIAGIGEVAAAGGVAAGLSEAGAGGLSTLLGTSLAARSSFHGTAQERYDKVLAETGNTALADDATNTAAYYAEAGLDLLSDVTLLGGKLINTGRAAKLIQANKAGYVDSLAKSVAKKLGVVSEKGLGFLTKGADVAGDIILEGSTEAAQGFVQDEDLNAITNTVDKFSGYDLADRAYDFLGGAAGGAAVAGAKFVTPSQAARAERLNRDEAVRSTEDAVTQIDPNFIDRTLAKTQGAFDAVQGKVDSALSAVAPVIKDTINRFAPGVSKLPAKVADTAATGFLKGADAAATGAEAVGASLAKVYSGIRGKLGGLLGNKQVQESADAMGSIYEDIVSQPEPPKEAPEATTLEVTPSPEADVAATSEDALLLQSEPLSTQDETETSADVGSVEEVGEAPATGTPLESVDEAPSPTPLPVSEAPAQEDLPTAEEDAPIREALTTQEDPGVTRKRLDTSTNSTLYQKGMQQDFLATANPEVADFLEQTVGKPGRGATVQKRTALLKALKSPALIQKLKGFGLSPTQVADKVRLLQYMANTKTGNAVRKQAANKFRIDVLRAATPAETLQKVGEAYYKPSQLKMLLREAGSTVAPAVEEAPGVSPATRSRIKEALAERFGKSVADFNEENNPATTAAIDAYIDENEITNENVDEVLNQDLTPESTFESDLSEGARRTEIKAQPGFRTFRALKNTGAFKGFTNLSPFEVKRIANKLGLTTDVVSRIGDPDPALGTTTGQLKGKEVQLAAPVLRSNPQASSVLLHEVAESLYQQPAVKQAFEDADVAAEARFQSDSMRFTPTADTKEQHVDAVAAYLADPTVYDTAHPNLGAALKGNASTKLKQAVQLIAQEAAIPIEQKLSEFQQETATAQEASRAALAARFVDSRTATQKVKDVLFEIRKNFFNSAARVFDVSEKLAKNFPQYKSLHNTLKNHYEQFKNRYDAAENMRNQFNLHFQQVAAKAGISANELSHYLQQNRIANEETFWEGNLKNIGGDQAAVLAIFNEAGLPVSPDTERLLLGNTREFITGIDQVAANVYAEGKGWHPPLQEIKNTDAWKTLNSLNPTAAEAILAAINPENSARGRTANPGLVTREDATRDIERIRNAATQEQKDAYDKTLGFLGNVSKVVARTAFNAGKIGKETLDFYERNAGKYATFQLSEAIVENPYVDAAMRQRTQEGLPDYAAPTWETTALKFAAIMGSSRQFAFNNSVVQTFQAAEAQGGAKVEAVASTQGKGKIPIGELITNLKNGMYDEEDSTTVLTADNGEYTVHVIADPHIHEAIYPKSYGEQSQAVKYLNQSQIVARAFFTTFSPAFAARSGQRIASRIFSVKPIGTGAKPTARETVSNFLRMPFLGVPIDANDRHIMSRAWTLAGDYLKSKRDLQRRLIGYAPLDLSQTSILDSGPASSVIVQQLTANGYLIDPTLVDITSGIDPDTLTSQGTPLVQTQAAKEIQEALNGRPHKPGVFEKVNQSTLTPEVVKKGVAYVESYFNFVRDLNTRLELTEKLAGIEAIMKYQNKNLSEALADSNLYFGNPDPRGGGYNKAALHPFFLFASPAINGMRSLANVYKSGVQGEDSRLVQGALIGLRGSVMGHPLVWGAATYALSRALLGSDDEASKQAEVVRRLIEKVPQNILATGSVVPLAFRDPRSRDWIAPWNVNSVDEIDPAWETVYLQAPLDQTTAFTAGLVRNVVDGLSDGVGVSSLAANLIGASFRNAVPTIGPIPQTALSLTQVARGENPTDWFTGRPALSKEGVELGGLAMGTEYLHYLAHNFVPSIPFSKGKETNKTRIGEPFDSSIVDGILEAVGSGAFGVLNSSNYGDVQRARLVEDGTQKIVKADVSGEALNKLERITELNRLGAELKMKRDSELREQGIAPSSDSVSGPKLLPEQFRTELQLLNAWKRGEYDTITEQAEIELAKKGKTSRYWDLIESLK